MPTAVMELFQPSSSEVFRKHLLIFIIQTQPCNFHSQMNLDWYPSPVTVNCKNDVGDNTHMGPKSPWFRQTVSETVKKKKKSGGRVI